MTTFACAAQDVPLQDGSVLRFAAHPEDHALCTLAMGGHVLVFQRNGALLRVEQVPKDPPAKKASKESDDGKDKRRFGS